MVLHVIMDDPDDNRVLECAVKGMADYIVRGDRHLLKLGSYNAIFDCYSEAVSGRSRARRRLIDKCKTAPFRPCGVLPVLPECAASPGAIDG
jgi:hypothetical protein